MEVSINKQDLKERQEKLETTRYYMEKTGLSKGYINECKKTHEGIDRLEAILLEKEKSLKEEEKKLEKIKSIEDKIIKVQESTTFSIERPQSEKTALVSSNIQEKLEEVRMVIEETNTSISEKKDYINNVFEKATLKLVVDSFIYLEKCISGDLKKGEHSIERANLCLKTIKALKPSSKRVSKKTATFTEKVTES